MPYLYELLPFAVTPLQNNVIVSLLTVVYYKICIEVVTWLRVRSLIYHSSQALQGLQCLCIVFWPLYDLSDWSWRLNVLVPSSMMVRLLYKGFVLKDPEDTEVQNLSQSSSPTDLLFGPLQSCLVLIWLGLYRFMTEEASILAAAMGLGDTVAPMIGKRFGRHVYRMPLASQKTMEGTIVGVFLGTVCGCYLYLYLLGIPLLPLRMILAYGGIAAMVEGTAVSKLDNLVVPMALHFSIGKVQEWLPA